MTVSLSAVRRRGLFWYLFDKVPIIVSYIYLASVLTNKILRTKQIGCDKKKLSGP